MLYLFSAPHPPSSFSGSYSFFKSCSLFTHIFLLPSFLPYTPHCFLSCFCFSIFCPSLSFFSFSSAFLPCEVVELKRQNVDINPEYSESLDHELFTVHLMFEKPTAETALAAAAEAQQVRTSVHVCVYRYTFSLRLSVFTCPCV